MKDIRNIAIIAHVDHGKTTLVDALLRQSMTKLDKEIVDNICIMDSNDLERERGITIFSKNASIEYKGTRINIVDTPGHADFGGEVERVLSLADGCLLLVDAKEGPMPQTRFVLKKALEMNHKIIVVVNKIDKPDARPEYVVDKTFDLFVELGANDSYIDFPVIYASAKQGKAGEKPDLNEMDDITPLFEAIIKHIPRPTGDEEKPLQMLVTSIKGDDFKGRVATGRIHNGVIKSGQDIIHINREGIQKKCRVMALMNFIGLNRVEIKEASAGDIVAVAGIADINIGETIADPVTPVALPLLKIDEPTIKMNFLVNDSPFAGREGQYTTSRQVRARLMKELETDMALRVTDGVNNDWVVCGRGELHLAILIERMRREGFEFQVSAPEVIEREINGVMCSPFEILFVETPEAYSGAVIQMVGIRHGEMKEMRTENGIVFLEFIIPTRGLFGFRSEFLTTTRGTGIMNTIFYDYLPGNINWQERERGSLVAHETGVTNLYGLVNVQDRGVLFLGPGSEVYKGQVVGQSARSGDISINVCKTKHLTNMRSKGDGVSDHFNAPKEMGLEDALEYIGDDELVEVTPKTIRIRKVILDRMDEKRKMRGIVKQ